MEQLLAFFAGNSVWVYLFIFVGKIVEVSFSTLRIVLVGRGERLMGCLCALVEISLWLLITSSVLANFTSDPLKMVVYVLAFASGVFLGSWLEEKLAFGLCTIQIVAPDQKSAENLEAVLRKNGFGLTIVDAKGIDGAVRTMLNATLKRKRSREALALIGETCPEAVVTVSDVKSFKGGYLRHTAHGTLWRSLFK